ncbi:hypothetical protein ZWY2020_024624, partial [Hordeum vulgare]
IEMKNLPLARQSSIAPCLVKMQLKSKKVNRDSLGDTFESFLYVPMRTVMVSTRTLLLAFYAMRSQPRFASRMPGPNGGIHALWRKSLHIVG